MKIVRISDNKVFSENCKVARSFGDRLIGLMGKPVLPSGHSLLLQPCNSVHTFFMKFPIDVVYLDDSFKVLSIRRNMKPWRVDLPVFGARRVLELSSGSVSDLKEGDILCLS